MAHLADAAASLAPQSRRRVGPDVVLLLLCYCVSIIVAIMALYCTVVLVLLSECYCGH